jgi:hypothetical protein
MVLLFILVNELTFLQEALPGTRLKASKRLVQRNGIDSADFLLVSRSA